MRQKNFSTQAKKDKVQVGRLLNFSKNCDCFNRILDVEKDFNWWLATWQNDSWKSQT